MKKSSSSKRSGGSGEYQVVYCGAAGHNIRSKPGIKGTPVGRLTKGNKVDVSDEVRTCLCEWGLGCCEVQVNHL